MPEELSMSFILKHILYCCKVISGL